MDQLFKKAVCLTDLHFGRSANSLQQNQDNIDFIAWFCEEAKTWGAETCFMLGDWSDNRANIAVSTLNYSLRGIEMLNESFNHVWWLPGNHDLFYRDRRDYCSSVFAKHLPNVHFVNEPMTIDGVTIMPWLVGDEHKMLKSMKSRYAFGHCEIGGGFLMNAKVEMPTHEGGITASDINGPEYLFSGHFHFRQAKKNIVYIGNIFPMSFSDDWDDDRGMMFLEWGKDPQFKAWPEQPTFRTMRLSNLLHTPEKLLLPKMTARVSLDVDITYEEAQVIRDEYVSAFGLRKLELVHQPKESVAAQDFTGDIQFQSVDQIVIEGLQSVTSREMKPELLVEIYKALPNL